jgi:hypothetical protein
MQIVGNEFLELLDIVQVDELCDLTGWRRREPLTESCNWSWSTEAHSSDFKDRQPRADPAVGA